MTARRGRAAARLVGSRRSVVLGYHGVGRAAAGRDPHNHLVPPDRFRRQLELLLGWGFRLVTVSELASRLRDGGAPPGLAALSFDDGMESNHSVLLPILREYGVPATVYVITGLIGRPNPYMDDGSRMMDEPQLRDLTAAGIELGAHTVTHPDMELLDRESCRREMSDSRATLERIAGVPVTTFAYPYCRYGPEAVAAARDVGFAAAVTGEGRGGWRPLELKRSIVTGVDGTASFLLKVADAYQWLFDSRAGRVVRATTRGARMRVRERRDG